MEKVDGIGKQFLEQPDVWSGEESKKSVQTFRDLIAWQLAMDFAVCLYELTEAFPRREDFALAQQIRRAATSISSNIAEGFGRGSLRHYINFLEIARGSLYETQSQLELASRLGMAASRKFRKLEEDSRELERVLSALIRSLRRRLQSA